MDDVEIAEAKKREMAAREEARMARLLASDTPVDVAPETSNTSSEDHNLTPEEREMARLNKHWITDAPKVTHGLTNVPKDSPTKKEDNHSPHKGAIAIVRPSFAPKGSAAKALEITGETESQMLERRLKEAKAKAYAKQKAEKEHSAWKEKEKERAKQTELQIQARKQKEQEERAKAEKLAEERREKERKDQEERARLERERALKDSDPAVHDSAAKGSWSTSGEFDVVPTPEEQSEASKKEEARMKKHFL